jgi:hypothetical protein
VAVARGDIILDRAAGPALWIRRPLHTLVGRIGGVAATVAVAWWATALPHTAVRWAAVAVPAAFLVAASWGVERNVDPPSEWWARALSWIRNRLFKDLVRDGVDDGESGS